MAAKYITNQKAELDIHNMTADQAKKEIERFLSRADASVTEVTIIHGYSGGTVLQNMVRNQLKHRRIKSKGLSLINPGITRLVLK